jgi:haloalkane dehalogenase
MHYVDEGTGPVLLFLHGNPTWSFYYRHCISGLKDRARCIAPDFLGFGLSDRPAVSTFGYTPGEHAATIDTLIGRLGLESFTLVVHEWGGPIGLDCASREPQKLRALVVMNSWFWPVATDRRFRRSSYAGAGVGRGFLSKALNLPIETMFTRHGRSQVPHGILEAYRAVQEDAEGRDGIRILKRELVRATKWLQAVRDRQPKISARPTLLLWGDDDHLFGHQELRTWEVLFQDTRTVHFEHAGHYVCEEAGPALVDNIAGFLDSIDRG